MYSFAGGLANAWLRFLQDMRPNAAILHFSSAPPLPVFAGKMRRCRIVLNNATTSMEAYTVYNHGVFSHKT